MTLSASLLAGCSDVKEAKGNVDAAVSQTNNALAQAMPATHIMQPLEVDNSPYYGATARPIANGDALPSQFEQAGAVVLTFARPVTMEEFARMVQSVTGLRANVSASHGAGASAASSATDSGTTFMPSDGEQVSGGRVVWQGRLSDLLNQASDVFKADWSFDGDQISFSQELTRTFMLHALAGDISLTGSVASGSSSTGNLPQVNISSTSGLKIWDDIKAAVDTIMGDGGTAAYSQSTGTITVTATPDVVRRVESYLNQQNAMRLRRIAIGVKVLKITLNKSSAYDTDITGIVKKAFGEAGLQLAQTTVDDVAGLAFTVKKDRASGTESTFPSDQLVASIRLTKGVSDVSVVHSGTLMTLSDQPAPLQVGNQVSYLARTSTTSGDTSSVSLEPGTFDTGLMMTVLPRIVESDKILMRVSLSISDLNDMKTFGPTDNQIQLPDIATTGFLQNAVLTSGETLVLAGFEKERNDHTDNGAPGVLKVLQSARDSSVERDAIVLLLTSQILPEEPMTVIGN